MGVNRRVGEVNGVETADIIFLHGDLHCVPNLNLTVLLEIYDEVILSLIVFLLDKDAIYTHIYV